MSLLYPSVTSMSLFLNNFLFFDGLLGGGSGLFSLSTSLILFCLFDGEALMGLKPVAGEDQTGFSPDDRKNRTELEY